ncbi:MAG: hypothetical protein CXX81_14105 [Methanobacteriota archaeon]|nr:MAG: hypothetical protein CXX81_14105 [Euryarchaeota archaeon]
MTTQSVKCKIGSSNLVRNFSDTATDSQVFTGNNLLDDNANQNLGILIPGVVVDQVQMTYTAGLAQWRIIDAITQKTQRRGFASKTGYVCPMETKIQPYQIKKSDLLQVFPKAVNATAGDTEVMAWLVTNGGTESFSCTTSADSTATAMTNSITGQTLGDWCFGQTLQKIAIQCEDGAFLSEVRVLDQTGSNIWSSFGGQRLPTAGGKSTHTNLEVECNIPVMKGYAIQVLTVTA